MAIVSSITEPQPQIAQLECLFKGPLTTGSVVELFEDLILIPVDYNYEHKRIWVKEHKCNYYLDNGTGSELINWKKESVRIVITHYLTTELYQPGECVYQNGKIYTAKINVPEDHNPSDYDDFWLCISGETETYRYLFFNVSSVIIYTEIRNPKFEIVLGDFVYDGEGNIVINSVTNLAELLNMEIVDASIVKRDDLPPSNGIAYEISFYEDNALSVQLSGCVNVK